MTKEERKDLEYFLRKLMIQDSGAYVLFGSKPMCIGGFFESSDLEKMRYYSRDLNKGWDIWEKLRGDGHRYMLVKRSAPLSIQWPDHRKDERIAHTWVLADVKKTALVLAQHYELFKSLVGMDFHPVDIVFDLENPDSVFWNHLLFSPLQENQDAKIHRALGLLLGFGEENALLFSWREEARQKKGKMSALFAESEGILYRKEREIFEDFPTPGYISFDKGLRLAKYEQERKMIQNHYRGKDFLEVTLSELRR